MSDPNRWWVYIIECEDGSLYTGISTDPEKRFAQHAEGPKSGGAKFFNRTKPLKFMLKEGPQSRSEASKRECQIKALSRIEKEKLIKDLG
jgi:putative endonuclease